MRGEGEEAEKHVTFFIQERMQSQCRGILSTLDVTFWLSSYYSIVRLSAPTYY